MKTQIKRNNVNESTLEMIQWSFLQGDKEQQNIYGDMSRYSTSGLLKIFKHFQHKINLETIHQGGNISIAKRLSKIIEAIKQDNRLGDLNQIYI